MRSGRLGVGRAIIFEQVLFLSRCVFEQVLSVIEGRHGQVTGSTAEVNGFSDALVQKRQKGWFDEQCSEFTVNVGSLLAALGGV